MQHGIMSFIFLALLSLYELNAGFMHIKVDSLVLSRVSLLLIVYISNEIKFFSGI